MWLKFKKKTKRRNKRKHHDNKIVLVAIFKFKLWMILKTACRHFCFISLDFPIPVINFHFLKLKKFDIETEGQKSAGERGREVEEEQGWKKGNEGTGEKIIKVKREERGERGEVSKISHIKMPCSHFFKSPHLLFDNFEVCVCVYVF